MTLKFIIVEDEDRVVGVVEDVPSKMSLIYNIRKSRAERELPSGLPRIINFEELSPRDDGITWVLAKR
jgi:hypothetical protein